MRGGRRYKKRKRGGMDGVYEIRKRGNYKFFRIFERFDENWGNVWIVSLENATRVHTYGRKRAFGKWNIISIDRRNVKYLSSAFVSLFLEWRIRKRG